MKGIKQVLKFKLRNYMKTSTTFLYLLFEIFGVWITIPVIA